MNFEDILGYIFMFDCCDMEVRGGGKRKYHMYFCVIDEGLDSEGIYFYDHKTYNSDDFLSLSKGSILKYEDSENMKLIEQNENRTVLFDSFYECTYTFY